MPPDIALEDALCEPSALARPVCVGLDGTLLATHTLAERIALLFRERPWAVLALPFWSIAGRARLEERVARRVQLDPTSLPYRPQVVTALKRCRDAGRRVMLVAPGDRRSGELIAEHLGLFDAVFPRDAVSAQRSQETRQELIAAFPEGFDYVGHGLADQALLSAAKRGFLVSASRTAALAVRNQPQIAVVSRRPSILRALVSELRPHQWAKNALVVLPVLLAPNTPPLSTLIRGVLAALTFSLCASAGYVFNDLLDLEADRVHLTKAKRPFASGALPIIFGFPLFIGLLLLSFSLAVSCLPHAFVAMLAVYFAGTLSYSLYLKRLTLTDVLVLAALYTHRILSGGVATGVRVSGWLFGFSMFLFTSLAFAKRFVELHAQSSDEQVKNRGYSRVDLPMVTSMGTASGYIAALVFMLYVDSSAVSAAYREPSLLWLVLPALLYWLGRIWLLAGRGQMQEDPVKFALRDRKSLMCVALIGLIAVTARFTPAWVSQVLH